MLDYLEVKNFQAHKKRRLEFDPAITTIVGRNDVGKSALLRALKWVCLNLPVGDDFLRWDASKVIVRLGVDGRTVTRRRGSSSGNIYKLDKKTFHAFGRDVPPEIDKFLNVDHYNFQGQLDSPFWIALEPGQVSRQLNQIINLGVIDETLSNVAGELRKARTEVEVVGDRLLDAREQGDKLAHVPTIAAKLETLEALDAKRTTLAATVDSLGFLSRRGARHAQTLGTSRKYTQTARKVVSLGESVLAIDGEIADLGKLAERMESLSSVRQLPSLDHLEGKQRRIRMLLGECLNLDGAVREIVGLKRDRAKVLAELKKLETHFHKLSKGRCPICRRRLKS